MNVRRESGFSLIEVLVAIAVFMVLVLAISLIPSLTLGRLTNNKTYATNIARQAVETYRSAWSFPAGFKDGLTPTSLPSGLRNGCELLPPVTSAFVLELQSGKYTLTAVTGGEEPDVRRVVVTVRCPRMGDVTLRTELGDPSPSEEES